MSCLATHLLTGSVCSVTSVQLTYIQTVCQLGECRVVCSLHGWQIADLCPKWVRLAPNGTNPGFFQISSPSQNLLNLILNKLSDLSLWPTLGPNLATLILTCFCLKTLSLCNDRAYPLFMLPFPDTYIFRFLYLYLIKIFK